MNDAITIGNLFFWQVSGTGAGAAVEATLRKNYASTALKAGGTNAGVFEDTADTVAVVSGDDVDIGWTSGTGSNRVGAVSVSLTDTNGTMTSYNVQAGSSGFAISTTYFLPLEGDWGLQTTESGMQFRYQYPTTLSQLYCMVTTNAQTAASTLRTRKNATNGAQSASITASTTGAFRDNANSDSIVSGDRVNYSLVTGAGGHGNTQTLQVVETQQQTTGTDEWTLTNGSAVGVAVGAAGGNGFMCVGGGVGWGGVESGTNFKIRVSGFVGLDGFVNLTANTDATAGTLRTRKNYANASVAVSITANTTGSFEDLANVDGYAVGDFINWNLTSGNGETISVMGLTFLSSGAAAPGATAFFQHSGPLRLERFNPRHR